MLDREIKVSPKMEKRLIYLGFEEKGVDINKVPKYKIDKRYFVHPTGLQVRVNTQNKNLTILSKHGKSIITKSIFLTSEIKLKIKHEK